jgi:hypothetical protein
MATDTFELQAETSRLVAAFEELYRYTSLEGFQEAFERAFGTEYLATKLVRCEVGPTVKGAILVTLEPTDRFLDFLAAARAGDLQRKVNQ